MSVSTPVTRELATPQSWTSALAVRLADYGQLIKPRISLMVLVTVSVGYYLANDGSASAPLWAAWLGIALLAAASSALNQWWERDHDALMARTSDRPIPSGRMSAREVLAFGVLAGITGFVVLATMVNLLTAALTAATCLSYVFIYTPLKSRSLLCTTIGAIPGAMPPVLGWTAAGGELNIAAGSLFAMLFLWQFPHFLAIAWLYRRDYAEAGLKMLPAGPQSDRIVGLSAVAYAVCLVGLALLPSTVGLAGPVYGCCAIALTLLYVAAAMRFAWRPSRLTARSLLTVSLVHLPLLLLILTWDHWRGLSSF
jgi:protoheme IX farnesyltransferase